MSLELASRPPDSKETGPSTDTKKNNGQSTIIKKRYLITQNVSREAGNAVISAMTDSPTMKEKVTLVGFGTFGVRQRMARTGRNPQTGAALQIPAKKVAKFLPGKTLKEKIG